MLQAPFTALPTLLNIQTGDIGVNGLGRFPLGLSGTDVTSFFSGSLILSQGEDVSNILRFDLTDVTVSPVPEPSTAALMLVSFIGLATRRRR